MTIENTDVQVSSTSMDAGTSSDTSSSSSTTTEAPTSDSSLPVGSSGATAPVPAPGAAAADGTVVPPGYTPNLKFSVKGKELEIDKLFHGMIKDADTEKKIRELHEKAYGLDSVKEDRTRTRQELDTVKTSYEAQNNYLTQMGKALRSGDAETFFDGVGVAGNVALENVILQWALGVAQRRQNPQANAEYMRERSYQEQTSTYEQQVEACKSNFRSQAELQECPLPHRRVEVEITAKARN